MPHPGYDNHYVTFRDKNPKSVKTCEVLIERFGCEHEDHTIHRCEAHAGLPQVAKKGNYCDNPRLLDGKPPM